MFTTVHSDFLSPTDSCSRYHKTVRRELVSHYRVQC